MNAMEMYDTIYMFASHECREIFGDDGSLAREAFRRSTAGDMLPGLWLELPLLGRPRFDLHITYGKEAICDGAPFPQQAADGHGALLNWYAEQKTSSIAGLALGYDAGEGHIQRPAAVHALVEGAENSGEPDVEGLFSHLGRSDAAPRLAQFLRRVPREWRLWYFGIFTGRPDAPVRADFFVDSMKGAYAKDTSLLAAHLSQMGIAASSDTMRIAEAILRSPFELELQFDVLPDGSAGPTVGLSAGFHMESIADARRRFRDGDAARLLEFAEKQGLADGRWRCAERAFFARGKKERGGMRVVACAPKFVKFRIRDGAALDAKIYLAAWAADTWTE